MNLNKVFILGNLTRDPELRQTPNGQAVCTFNLATNRFYTDSSGTKQKQAEFHTIVAWGRQAEVVNQYLKKGSSALVEGRLQTRSWQDQQGTKHWRTEVIAERVQLGPRLQPSQGGNNGGGGTWRNNDENTGNTPHPRETDPQQPPPEDQTPIIELPDDGEEIDVKDIPF